MKLIHYQDLHGETGYAAQQADGTAWKLSGNIFDSPKVTTEKAIVAKLLAPIQPSSIICIGLNYRRHAQETGAKIPEFPVVFFKGINTLLNPGDPILLPTHLKSDEVDYECELAVVIGRAGKNISRQNALDYVLGYTASNDVS